MLADRGELPLVLRAHARLRLCSLAFPLRHLGVPLIELGLQLRDVFFTLGCHVSSFRPRRKKVYDSDDVSQKEKGTDPLQFAFTPAARKIAPSVARSSRIWASNCSGLIGMGSAPSLAWRSRTSGDFRGRPHSALSLWMMCRGVCPGARTPVQKLKSAPRPPGPAPAR